MNSADLYQAALRLRNDPFFAPFRQWLLGQQEAALRVMRTGEGAPMHRAQGAFTQIELILELLDSADAALSKLSNLE